MSTGISFDSNSLQTSSILTAEINHANPPQKDIQFYPLAHANKSAASINNYPQKKITISGKIIGSGITNLDSLLDTFKSYFRGTDKNLDIDYNGGTRRYIATLNALSIDRPGGLQYANFEAEFTCTNPFGKATSSTNANTASNITTSGNNYTHTYTGTAPFQLPVITITLDAVTGTTGHMTVKDNTTGQGITIIGQTFAAADVIVIDCVNRKVTKNGTEIDFLGSFPELAPGSQTLRYEDGFTTRQYDLSIDYTPLYL